jgi:hypothetical protein
MSQCQERYIAVMEIRNLKKSSFYPKIEIKGGKNAQ